MKYFLSSLFLFVTFSLFSQVSDNFNDADFTTNPTWIGDDSVFTVVDVTGNLKLRSNKLLASSTYYLASANTLLTNTEWQFAVDLTFNTSSANFVDIYVAADQSNLMASNLNGYFVRIGGTTDEISFYKNENGSVTKIIDGVDGVTNSSSNNLLIKVSCSSSGDWLLQYDEGAGFVSDGGVNDVSITSSNFFGFKITHSTASFIQKHFFDDISISTIGVDAIPPSLTAINVVSATEIEAVFSENITSASAQNLVNYSVTPSVSITNAVLDGTNQSLVHLTLNPAMTSGNQYALSVMNISDIAGNVLVSQAQNFTYTEIVTAVKGDIIINEFMADPSPIVGLPEVEFVEIYNKSEKSISLANWKLSDNTADGTIASSVINPGEYKVLCATANIGLFSNAIGVTSFQSLNNTGDDIILKDETGNIIDKITYDISWYNDSNKDDGGYSIELKNPVALCGNTENWRASTDPSGGTPGAQNATFDNTPDTKAPSITNLELVPPTFLAITFSEKMDSLSLVNATLSFNPSLTVSSIYITESFPQSLLIGFSEPVESSTVYTITISNAADCSQNSVSLVGEFSLSETPLEGDLIINELLFNPLTGGADYIELKNVSTKIINLKNVLVANFDDDTIANLKQITFSKNLKPTELIVLTADSTFQKQTYPFAGAGRFIQMSTPSLNDDSSTLYLIANNTVIDKVSYTDDWHFALLDDDNGKSLERINPFAPSHDKNNWHTAASRVNFGTPGTENSQLSVGEEIGVVSLTTSTFSPDNDGFEDFLQINYTSVNTGMLANISVFDDQGRLIHRLAQNEYLGTKGSLVWDGTTETKQKASIGIYVLVFEAFDLEGNKLYKKLAFVLAGK